MSVEQDQSLQEQQNSKISDSRRKLVKTTAWAAPVVMAVTLPTHAQATPVVTTVAPITTTPVVTTVAPTTTTPIASCGNPICKISNLVLDNGTFGSLNFDADASRCSSELFPFFANPVSFLLFDNNANALTLNTDPAAGWENDLPTDYYIGGTTGNSSAEYIEMTITRISDGLTHKVCFNAARALGGASNPTGYISNIVVS